MANQIIYVDDVGQQSSGTIFKVAYAIATAAVCFVLIAARLSLTLSSQKPAAILAPHPIIEQSISLRLARCRAPCRVVSSHRHLGIQFAIGKGRHTGILMSRLKAYKQRLYTISRLTKLDRAARKLTHTGVLPQALWGSEILCICPTTRARLRSSVAGANGINQASRCATTAISLAFDRDPEVKYIRRVVGFWHRSLTFIIRSLSLREAWRDAYKQIVSGQKASWHFVNGPISAVIAGLTPHDWHLRSLDGWSSPAVPPTVYGDLFHTGPAYGVWDLLSFIEETVLASL